MAIVKIGDITGGTLSQQYIAEARVSCARAGDPACASSLPTIDAVVTAVTFVQGGCATPDVLVSMKSYPRSTFTGVGTTSPSVDFNIDLLNCSAGMPGIKYRIDPATSIVSSAQSIVALDASSKATGIGLQLLDGSGSGAFPLSTATTFGGYSSTGGSYQIPFKARYYQTGSSVSPGSANTTMTFTITYE